MTNGRAVRRVKSDGTLVEQEEHYFDGGRSRMILWFKSDEVKGKLTRAVEVPVRECLNMVKRDMPSVLFQHFEQMTKNLGTLKSKDKCQSVADMNLYFTSKPKVEFDIETYLKKTTTIDPMKIEYREEPSRCVIVNSKLKVQLHQMFQKTFAAVAAEINSFVMTDLNEALEDFRVTAEREKENADGIFERNKEMLEKKLSDEGAVLPLRFSCSRDEPHAFFFQC
jgi:hypothetical protein